MMRNIFLSSAVFWVLASCSSSDETRPVHEVFCKYWLQQCHLKARQRCPSSYNVVRNVRMDKVGGPEGSYKEFKMLFSCN